MEMALDHFGIRLQRSNQHSLRGACPLPTHSSKKSNESFSVHTGKNIWVCQSVSCASARQGRKGGNVLDFVSIMMSCSIRDAAVLLHECFISSPAAAQAKEKGRGVTNKRVSENDSAHTSEETNKPLSFTLKEIDHLHPYVRTRGIQEATATRFGIGFFGGRGTMSGRVVIPIHNEKGELVAYAGRAIDDRDPKYKLPAGFHKGLVLFNFHRVLKEVEARRPIVLVEGFFDCVNVDQAGFPVVALMGCSLSEAQEQLLTSDFNSVVVMLDGDEVGRKAAEEISARLTRKMFVRVVDVGEGRQPDQLSTDELKSLLSSSF